MPSLKNAFSNRSSSSSPSDSPMKHESKELDSEESSKPRLTRQRKLRHVTEVDLGLRPIHDRWSTDVNSPSPPTRLGHRSTVAVALPQPLPLPESNSFLRQSDRSRSPSRGDGDGGREGLLSTSSLGSYTCHQTTRKNRDNVATESSKSPTYRRHRGFPQDLNVESAQHNFRLNVPARSAPTSALSSPARSPQRFSTVDLFHSSAVVPREFQTSSALEFPAFDRFAGFSSQTPPRRTTQSPEYSPLHSPTSQSPCRNARSPTRVALHSHHISLPQNSPARHEGNSPANVHPLPLPPGVSKPSHSTTIRHVVEKPEGSLMKSQWQKGKLIGHGTFGSVYLATNRETGALCAMKEVDVIPDDPKSAECIKQLEQEIKVFQHLKHPNIVQYYGSEIVEDRFCIYLEYVYPGSISKYVSERCGAVTESVVRNFTRHILSGLAYLHSTKTIHRDIKGANLLVDSSGVVKLADFGLAKHLTGQATDLSLKGSPHWMAPEVLQSVMRKDSKSELAFAVDIWSLGCTVLEMLNGKPPWSEFSGVQAMFNVLRKSPPIPETLSLEGKDFLRRCFQRNPADRPSAVWLLDHPFVRHSCGRYIVQEFSGIKLMDTPHSPRDRNTHVKHLMPLSLGTHIRQGDCYMKSYVETSEVAATSRYSPRSTLEVLPNVSSPEVNCSPRNIMSPSTNIFNSLLIGTANNYPYTFSSPHGRKSYTCEM